MQAHAKTLAKHTLPLACGAALLLLAGPAQAHDILDKGTSLVRTLVTFMQVTASLLCVAAMIRSGLALNLKRTARFFAVGAILLVLAAVAGSHVIAGSAGAFGKVLQCIIALTGATFAGAAVVLELKATFWSGDV